MRSRHDPTRTRPLGASRARGSVAPPQGGATLPLGLRAGCRDMRSRHSSRSQGYAFASYDALLTIIIIILVIINGVWQGYAFASRPDPHPSRWERAEPGGSNTPLGGVARPFAFWRGANRTRAWIQTQISNDGGEQEGTQTIIHEYSQAVSFPSPNHQARSTHTQVSHAVFLRPNTMP